MLGRNFRTHRRGSHEAGEPRAAAVDEVGPSLARGPALLLGTLLTAAGLILFLEAGSTPTDAFPDGDAAGTEFLGIATNGWTAWFTTAAGALLLLGAAQHLVARLTSLLVGLALAACVVISLIDGDDVFGLAVANGWTQLGWAIPAGLLLLNSFMPRAHRRRHDVDDRGDRIVEPDRAADEHDAGARGDRVVAGDGHERPAGEDERVATGEGRSGRFARGETLPPQDATPPQDGEGSTAPPLSRRR